jgi:hypothetical protein
MWQIICYKFLYLFCLEWGQTYLHYAIYPHERKRTLPLYRIVKVFIKNFATNINTEYDWF